MEVEMKKFSYFNRVLIVLAMAAVFALLMPQLAISAPQSVETVELSNLLFNGQPSGIVVPKECGDFSLFPGHDFILIGEETVIYEKIDVQNKRAFMLMLLMQCPKALVLKVYNGKTEIAEFWLYDKRGQPHKVTKTEADKVWFGGPHLSCSTGKRT